MEPYLRPTNPAIDISMRCGQFTYGSMIFLNWRCSLDKMFFQAVVFAGAAVWGFHSGVCPYGA